MPSLNLALGRTNVGFGPISRDPFQARAFYAGWRVSAADLGALHGLRLAGADAPVTPAQLALAGPKDALVGGLLVPPQAQAIRLDAAAGVHLILDGKAVTPGAALPRLAEGYHSLHLSGALRSLVARPFRAQSQGQDLPLVGLDWPYGLWERIWPGENEGPAAPRLTRRLLLPSYRYQDSFPLADPFCALITGRLTALGAGGVYGFKMPLWCRGRLLIDGQQVYTSTVDQESITPLALKSGSQPQLELHLGPMRAPALHRGFQILWKRPADQAWTPLPATAVVPAF